MIDLWVERVVGGRAVAHEWADERIAMSCRARGPVATSLSHHRDWLAVGASAGERLGVDVLTVPLDVDFLDDTGLVLSRQEIEWVRAHPPGERGAAFAECWTRKEAFAKLRGTGLTADLRELTLTPDADDEDVAFWTAPIGDAFVAVATRGPHPADVRIHCPLDKA
jgi:phosphopantetheinyl transferase